MRDSLPTREVLRVSLPTREVMRYNLPTRDAMFSIVDIFMKSDGQDMIINNTNYLLICNSWPSDFIAESNAVYLLGKYYGTVYPLGKYCGTVYPLWKYCGKVYTLGKYCGTVAALALKLR